MNDFVRRVAVRRFAVAACAAVLAVGVFGQPASAAVHPAAPEVAVAEPIVTVTAAVGVVPQPQLVEEIATVEGSVGVTAASPVAVKDDVAVPEVETSTASDMETAPQLTIVKVEGKVPASSLSEYDSPTPAADDVPSAPTAPTAPDTAELEGEASAPVDVNPREETPAPGGKVGAVPPEVSETTDGTVETIIPTQEEPADSPVLPPVPTPEETTPSISPVETVGEDEAEVAPAVEEEVPAEQTVDASSETRMMYVCSITSGAGIASFVTPYAEGCADFLSKASGDAASSYEERVIYQEDGWFPFLWEGDN